MPKSKPIKHLTESELELTKDRKKLKDLKEELKKDCSEGTTPYIMKNGDVFCRKLPSRKQKEEEEEEDDLDSDEDED